jgi:hypothetical protein
MLAWIKRGALICGMFIAVWILMMVYWSSTNRMPTSTDILLYLVILPVVFLLAIWIVRKIRSAIAARMAANAAAAAAAAAAPAPGLPKDTESTAAAAAAAENAWTLAIVASALRSPHGPSAAALSAALKSQEARLPLDPELTDAEGFPVRSGRIAAADTEADPDTAPIALWITAAGASQPAWTPEQLRALALGGEVLTELAAQLQLHPELSRYVDTQITLRDAIALPSLQLIPVLPPHWPAEVRNHAVAWFTDLVTQQGWPAEKILPISPANTDHAASSTPLKLIDDLSLHTHRQSLPCLALLVACESFIGERSVAQWDAAGQLLKGKGNSGQTPGEGAAGFLIADDRQAALLQIDPASTLHRATLGRRDKSADASGRIDGAFLTGLAQAALKNANMTANITTDNVTLLIADSDHRSSRTAELMGLGYAVLPEIDLGSQCLKVAADCGSAGAVSCLTALALAHHAVATAAPDEDTAVLCVSNNDAFERAAVVLSPLLSPLLSTYKTLESTSPTAPAIPSQAQA